MQIEQNGINQETVNRMELYRRILLQNGFSEPICQKERSLHWMFYKETTGNSAFVVNFTMTEWRLFMDLLLRLLLS